MNIKSGNYETAKFKKSSQKSTFLQKLCDLIPQKISPSSQISPKDFSRERKLPFSKIIVYILSITATHKTDGVEIKSGAFFKTARRSGLWPDAEPVHKSAITKARKKVDWSVFETIFYEAVRLAYKTWPEQSEYHWHGMSAIAVDGAKFTLPATESLRNEFDPKSGLEYRGKGHYPQCLVSTAYDVFRRFPVARTIAGVNDSEREQVMKLLPYLPLACLLMFDRGYPSYQLIRDLTQKHNGHYLFRCPSQSTFRQIEQFVESGQPEELLWLAPGGRYFRSLSKEEKQKEKPILLRMIRLEAPDGTISVLITSLTNQQKYSAKEIVKLYFRRWEVESYYRDEKVYLGMENFHSRSSNGIKQELFSTMIMTVIARTLMMLSLPKMEGKEPQFKNTIRTLASDATVLTHQNPMKAIEIFEEILAEIRRVKYYRPQKPRPPQPRITKRTVKKWSLLKKRKATIP